MKTLLYSILSVLVLESSFAQNVAEVNPMGTKGIFYSQGIGSTNIETHYRGGIVSEIPVSTPIQADKIQTAIIGISQSNGKNFGVLGIAKTNLFNSDYAIGVSGSVSNLQGIGYGVQGQVFSSSVASDEVAGGDFRATILNNSNAGTKIYGVKSLVQSPDQNVNEAYGAQFQLRGIIGQTAIGNAVNVSLSNSSTATAYGGHFSVTAPSTAYAIYASAGTGPNKYAAWLNGNVLIGSGSPTSSDILEVNGSTTIKNNLKVEGAINLGSGTISKFIRIETTMSITYAANTFTTLTVNATGASIGDNVILNFTGDIGSLIISQIWVSAANTVSVKIYNPTATSNTFPNNIPARIILTR